jgi:hypothetical protein
MVQYLGLTRVKKRQIINDLDKQRKVLVCVVKMQHNFVYKNFKNSQF